MGWRRWSASPLAVIALLCGCNSREGDPPGSARTDGLDSLLNEADRTYWAGETDSAKVLYDAVAIRARVVADPAAQARAATGLGRVAYRQDDYRLARQLAGESLDLKLRHGLHDQLFDSYNLLGLIAFTEGRYAEAIDHHGTARDLALAAADTTNLAKVWTNLALSHVELGEFGRARVLLAEALPAARASGQGVIEGRVLTNLGMLAVRTGQPDSAIRLLEEGLGIVRAAQDRLGEQNNLGQLGTAYAALGEPGRAIAYLDSAAAQARRTESFQEEASDLEHLANLHHDAGEFPRALELLGQARARNERLGLSEETGANLRSAAEVHLALGNLEPARRMAESALAIHAATASRIPLLSDHLVRARIAVRGRRPELARSALAAARKIADDLDSPLLRARVALAAARAGDELDEPANVIEGLRRAAGDLPFVGQDRAWEVHWLIARAQARLGKLDSAIAAGRRSVAAIERTRIDFGSPWLRTSFLAERAAAYLDLVLVLLRTGRVEEALEIADAARGRVLLDRLAALRVTGAATARELAEGERQLIHQIEQLTGRIAALGAGDDPDLSARYQTELTRLMDELGRTRTAFESALIRAEEQAPRSLGLLGARTHAADVRAALRRDEALLEFFVGPDRVIVFAMTQDTIAAVSTAVGREQLEARVRVTRELLARSGNPTAVEPALAALHHILIAPVLAERPLVGRRRLVVVPHGILTYLPFSALHDRDRGRYLVEDFEILLLPSAGALPALRGGHSLERPGTGPPVAFAPFPDDLPGTEAEARAFRSAIDGARAVIGRGATEAAVRAALRDAAVVHIATHGLLNAHNPLFSRIALAPSPSERSDGQFEVHEVDRTPIGASLVFLSGCETGLSATGSAGGRGDGYSTLAQAFLHAGAGNVVATLWRIADDGAAAFAAAFYRELGASSTDPAERGTLAEALAQAQRSLLRHPQYRAPFYWAGYQLIGGGEIDRARVASQGTGGLSVPESTRPIPYRGRIATPMP